jgi:hypothetical protein
MKLAGAIVVCAAAAFAVAFFATGAASTAVKHVTHHAKPLPFADSAASDVSFAGAPAALKLPPPPKPVKHHKHAAATTPVSAPASTPSTPTVTPAAPVYNPPPKHKAPSGTGTGTTTVGP